MSMPLDQYIGASSWIRHFDILYFTAKLQSHCLTAKSLRLNL